MNVVLVGYMGSGKTSLGKKLASRLGLTFIDTDKCIEADEGKTISEIFTSSGEQHFRTLEKELVEKIKSQDNMLISTGGGMPCFNNLMEDLNQLGTTIYLKRPAKELAHRIFNSKKIRPLVVGKSFEELVEYIENVLTIREPQYEKAHISVDREIQNISSLELLLKSYLNTKTK